MLKEILLYVVSAGVGTFICKILEKTPMNVWFARGIGCMISVAVVLLLYKVWMKKAE